MKNRSNTQSLMYTGAALVAALSFGLVGCSSDDSSDTTPADAGTTATSTLYLRLGGHAGIRSAINAIVGAELMDPTIASFFGQLGDPGHPTADQLEECFTDLLASAAGGTEVYPTTGDGFQCRSMSASHSFLHIPSAVFDNFVVIAAGELKTLGVAEADITTIGTVLNGTKTDIVDPDATGDGGI